MAWRIDEQVIRGEIDNRRRGRVTGRIWLTNRPEPVELDLSGNCWRDLAGRRLEFSNPHPRPGDLDGFAARQEGAVGDITASRKVKVPEIPRDRIGEYCLAKKPFPWHWGNSLYLEWFSALNGRVVIESAGFALAVAGEPAWEMSETEEEQQRRTNGAAMTGFMNRLAEAAGIQERGAAAEPAPEWSERRPLTEEEAEAEQARSDRLADRIEARLQREGGEAYENILEEEIERLHREEGRPEPTSEQRARHAEWIEEANRAAGEASTNMDPELEAELNFEHALAVRVREFARHLWTDAGGWRPDAAGPEHPVAELLDATMIAGPKLAGALNGQAWPPDVDFCAHTIVRLKRARGYLEDGLRATESCREEKLLPPERLGPVVDALVEFIRETDALIAELRAKLARGTD